MNDKGRRFGTASYERSIISRGIFGVNEQEGWLIP